MGKIVYVEKLRQIWDSAERANFIKGAKIDLTKHTNVHLHAAAGVITYEYNNENEAKQEAKSDFWAYYLGTIHENELKYLNKYEK